MLGLKTAKRYCRGKAASARSKGEFVILDFYSDDEPGDDIDDGSGWLSALIPLRADIANSDYRALYLAWLLCAQQGELDDDEFEPPVPPGLGTLTASLKAFAEFLRIDGNLITVAAQRSVYMEDKTSLRELRRRIVTLPESEKTDWLVRFAAGNEVHLRTEFLRQFRETRPRATGTAATPRTVTNLLAARRASYRKT